MKHTNKTAQTLEAVHTHTHTLPLSNMEIAYLAESYSLENRGAELKKSCTISCMRIDERRKHKIGITLEKLA